MSTARLALEAAGNRRVLHAAAAVEGTDDGKPAAPANALTALTRYIPTEIITLYVATLSAKDAILSAFGQDFPLKSIYWAFAGLTPVLFALVFVSGVYQKGDTLATAGRWPWWPMLASLLSFLVWGLSVPQSPYYSAGAAALLGVASLLVSALLTLFDPIFDRKTV